jgi:hypothetical protein
MENISKETLGSYILKVPSQTLSGWLEKNHGSLLSRPKFELITSRI